MRVLYQGTAEYMCQSEVLRPYGEWDVGTVFCVSASYDGADSGRGGLGAGGMYSAACYCSATGTKGEYEGAPDGCSFVSFQDFVEFGGIDVDML